VDGGGRHLGGRDRLCGLRGRRRCRRRRRRGHEWTHRSRGTAGGDAVRCGVMPAPMDGWSGCLRRRGRASGRGLLIRPAPTPAHRPRLVLRSRLQVGSTSVPNPTAQCVRHQLRCVHGRRSARPARALDSACVCSGLAGAAFPVPQGCRRYAPLLHGDYLTSASCIKVGNAIGGLPGTSSRPRLGTEGSGPDSSRRSATRRRRLGVSAQARQLHCDHSCTGLAFTSPCSLGVSHRPARSCWDGRGVDIGEDCDPPASNDLRIRPATRFASCDGGFASRHARANRPSSSWTSESTSVYGPVERRTRRLRWSSGRSGPNGAIGTDPPGTRV
jgi:hypothetical protein